MTPQTLVIEKIRAAREGDDAAFEEIMILTERRVAQIAWQILGNAEDVKDAMQETFVRFFRHLRRYDENQDLHAWLARITINVCRDQLRQRKRLHLFTPLAEHAATAQTDEAPADSLLIGRALMEAIDSLPPKERKAVILRDIDGLSTMEVATALGTTVSTVRVQLSRARLKLRRLVAAFRGGKA